MSVKLILWTFLSILSIEATTAATFGEDVHFLMKYTDVVVLKARDGKAEVAISPSWQARVITSSSMGSEGLSYGWINRELIVSGKRMKQINAYGGEDRLWLGPEGSQFSIYFAQGVRFDPDNWVVPAPFDSEPFGTVRVSRSTAQFKSDFSLTNYSGTSFRISILRNVSLLEQNVAWENLGVAPLPGLALVAYETDNTLRNSGQVAWQKATGLLSVWILGMFNASPESTTVIPLNPDVKVSAELPVTVYKSYGDVPSDRLQVTDHAVFFRGDAHFRSKIGVIPKASYGKLGSYDAQRGVLTIVQFNQPPNTTDYVNSVWGRQEHPYAGDAINSYNDGPPSPGAAQLGQFFELESSSPAAALAPGQSITHVRRTFHLSGSEKELDVVSRIVLGVSLKQITGAFPSETQRITH